MTTAEMLFGSGDLAPSNAAWGRVLGYAQATVDAAKRKEEEPQPPEKKAG